MQLMQLHEHHQHAEKWRAAITLTGSG